MRGVGAALFALSPVVAGAIALSAQAPPPASDEVPRELLVVAGDRAGAARYPGRAVVALGALPGVPNFAELPFESVIIVGEDPPGLDIQAQGFVAAGMDPAGRRYTRQHRWSVTEEWLGWLIRSGTPEPLIRCTTRHSNGAFGCGGGVRLAPDLILVDGSLSGGIRVTPIPAGRVVELRIARAPSHLIGELVPRQPRRVSMIATRGGRSVPLECSTRCPLPIPTDDDGPITLRLQGPTPEVGIILSEASP